MPLPVIKSRGSSDAAATSNVTKVWTGAGNTNFQGKTNYVPSGFVASGDKVVFVGDTSNNVTSSLAQDSLSLAELVIGKTFRQSIGTSSDDQLEIQAKRVGIDNTNDLYIRPKCRTLDIARLQHGVSIKGATIDNLVVREGASADLSLNSGHCNSAILAGVGHKVTMTNVTATATNTKLENTNGLNDILVDKGSTFVHRGTGAQGLRLRGTSIVATDTTFGTGRIYRDGKLRWQAGGSISACYVYQGGMFIVEEDTSAARTAVTVTNLFMYGGKLLYTDSSKSLNVSTLHVKAPSEIEARATLSITVS